MQPTTEILDNVATMAEMLLTRNLSVPDLPYLELAKWIRLERPVSGSSLCSRDRSSRPVIIDGSIGSCQAGDGV
jgi:hypothetical protein